MKPAFVLALSPVLAMAQQSQQTVTITPAFRIDGVHLTYHTPPGLAVQTEFGKAALKVKTDQTTGAQKAVAACVTVPFTAINSQQGLRLVSVLRMDLTCLGYILPPEKLGALATSIATEGISANANPVVQSPHTFKLGTHDAVIVRMSSESAELKKTLYSASVCTIQQKNVLCWQFAAMDTATLEQLGAAKLQFDGEQEFAVFPQSN